MSDVKDEQTMVFNQRWSKSAMPTPEDIGEENSGPGAEAVRSITLKNNAHAFDERSQGYPVMERSKKRFYKRLRASLGTVLPKP